MSTHTMSTADTLAAAARRLDDIASRATPGPWEFEPAGESSCGEPACCSDWWGPRVWADSAVLEEFGVESDARLIATLDPVMAGLLAEALQLQAERAAVSAYTATPIEVVTLEIARHVLRP